MNRKDLPWILLLGALVLSWTYLDRRFVAPRFQRPETAPPETAPRAPAEPGDPAAEFRPADPAAGLGPGVPAETEPPETAPEQFARLSNDRVELTFTSHGAGLVKARLLDFAETPDPESPPVLLDFSDRPALSYEGLPGLGGEFAFELQALDDGQSLRFERSSASGVRMVRTVTLGEGYLLSVRDRFVNERPGPGAMPPHDLRVGRLGGRAGETGLGGLPTLGLDTLSPGGDKVAHWGKGFAKLLRPARRGDPLPDSVERGFPGDGRRVEWAALKEKFFVLILTPEGGAEEVRGRIERRVLPRELAEPGYRPRSPAVGSVAADLRFGGGLFPGEGEARERNFTFYAGPKQYGELRRFAFHQVRVMEFGLWTPISNFLLWSLTALHRLIPNYGVAIILLTCLIRAVFWPLTHKSGQSMRKMQELAPEIARIKATVKDPQKQQRATMELYKKHKVNPVSGCLPMLIQMPFMIALFYVLRSAIELRYAPFLWIRDLSEPENLLPGVLPFVSGLNLLPLIMTGVQVLQQKLTPTTGDPSQQRMMAFMPIMMLFLFYHFASGLVLYWTVSQGLAVAQMAWQRKRPAPAPA